MHGAAVASRSGATVHVLNVVDLQSAGGVFNAGGLDEAFVERLEEQGQQAVDRLAAQIDEASPDVAVETEVARFTEFDGIAGGVHEYVDNHDVDLVVIGSHGRSNLKRQLLGSVATSLIGSLDVPVLVVPRDARS
ncbi:universal stress protein [Natronomonas salina]|uniref:universal stress protein n=1 Tax=Natronomonas salina TaxID=1710540 RepID=UPI001FEA9B9D|nr:universal stress protein [Natronomonas salina]